MTDVRIERPTREHAVQFAQARYLAGDRVDMRTLAADLGVGRTTLYRWVGDREQLLGEILSELAVCMWDQADAETAGTGIERIVGTAGRFSRAASAWQATRTFVRQEPALALHLILGADGAVRRKARASVATTIRRELPVAIDDDELDLLYEIFTSLVWTPLAIDEEPDIERAEQLLRVLLERLT
jgi:AcrR family transcriptional regulator